MELAFELRTSTGTEGAAAFFSETDAISFLGALFTGRTRFLVHPLSGLSHTRIAGAWFVYFIGRTKRVALVGEGALALREIPAVVTEVSFCFNGEFTWSLAL